MDKSSDRNSTSAVVKDSFEITAAHKTGHEPGLVVVLDRVISQRPVDLNGKVAAIRTPSGDAVRVRVDEAKDHLAATSLFFRNMSSGTVPVGSAVEIRDDEP